MNKNGFIVALMFALTATTILYFQDSPNTQNPVTTSSEINIMKQQIAQLGKQFEQRINNLQHEIALPDHKIISTQSAPQNNVELANVKVELASMREQLEKLLDAQSQNQLSAQNLPVAQSSVEEQIKRAERDQQQHIALLDQIAASDVVDPDWSFAAQSNIETKLADSLSVNLTNINCVTSLCRVEANTTQQTDAMDAYLAFNESLIWEGESFININENTGEITAYLARPGETLPTSSHD